MFATSISRGADRARQAQLGHWPQVIFSCLAASILFFADFTLSAAETNPATAVVDSAARKKAYLDTRSRFLAQTNNSEFGWQFARACFDRAVIATYNAERAKVADEGIAVARQVIARDATVAPAH